MFTCQRWVQYIYLFNEQFQVLNGAALYLHGRLVHHSLNVNDRLLRDTT